ncbi:9810_t:CDS:1, partial [Dentiscutata heterogama]
PDVRLVKITNIESKENGKYLLVELVNEEQDVGDVRNLEKRKYNEPMVNESLIKEESPEKY